MAQRADTGVVAVGVHIVLHDQSLNLYGPGFVGHVESARPSWGWYAVVADEGVREHEDLPAVGGIGQALRVAGHARVENDLTRYRFFGCKTAAYHFGAVFKDELHGLSRKLLYCSHLVCLRVTPVPEMGIDGHESILPRPVRGISYYRVIKALINIRALGRSAGLAPAPQDPAMHPRLADRSCAPL